MFRQSSTTTISAVLVVECHLRWMVAQYSAALEKDMMLLMLDPGQLSRKRWKFAQVEALSTCEDHACVLII